MEDDETDEEEDVTPDGYSIFATTTSSGVPFCGGDFFLGNLLTLTARSLR